MNTFDIESKRVDRPTPLFKDQARPEWLREGVHVRRKRRGVTFVVDLCGPDEGERAKFREITDGMPGAIWVTWKTLGRDWEPVSVR